MCRGPAIKQKNEISFMARKQFLILFFFAAFVFAAVVVGWFVAPRPRSNISFDSYSKICIGMTRARVEEVLGGPAGDYSGGTAKIHPYLVVVKNGKAHKVQGLEEIDWSTGNIWIGKKAAIKVEFSDDGTVRSKCFRVMWPIDESFYERISTWWQAFLS